MLPARVQRFSTPVFVSEQVGWIPTFDDRIFRTTASGWRETRVPNATFLAGLDFVGTMVGWTIAVSGDPVCGAPAARPDVDCRSTLLRTKDGGETWTEQSAITSHRTVIPLHGLRAISGDAVWAIHTLDCAPTASCPDEVVITEDAGQSWRATLAASRVLDLEASSASEAWVAISVPASSEDPYAFRYELRHTTDGGRSWRTTISSKNFLYATRTSSSLWVLERDGAYCTASDCSQYILRSSSDAGATWTALGDPKESATCTGGHLGVPTFSGRDLLTGVIPISLGAGGVRVGEGGLLETKDGGRTWTCTATPPNVSVARAVMGIVVAVSNDRATNTDSVWIRDERGRWSRSLP